MDIGNRTNVKILAIDTASTLGGVAVLDSGSGAFSEHRTHAPSRQFSESLIEMIDLCLRNTGIEMSQIDCLAVIKGPGSFTGLRVGLSAVKGLAYSLQKPLVAISTLYACAWLYPFQPRLICPVLDARKKEVYAAVYRWENDDFDVVLDEGVYKLEQVLAGIDNEVIFTGDGVKVYRKQIESKLGSRALFSHQHLMGGLPSAVAMLAARKAEKGEFSDAASLSPQYFRRSEAELGSAKKQSP